MLDNYMDLFVKETLKNRPQDFIINDDTIAEVERNAAATRKVRELYNPPKPQNHYEEYRQLRGRLYQLEQAVEHSTTYFTNIEGNVALLQENLQQTERSKNQALNVGNVRFEKNTDHTITRLKEELVDAQKELRRAKNNKERAAEVLKAFDQHERIAELKTQFGL